ncbi:MAG: hypothetical protein K9W43_14050 [Candidatus Thorarchaeota archaeon]|nr:hypothetical protein [Candidatus Thorarchaeota archaeon]
MMIQTGLFSVNPVSTVHGNTPIEDTVPTSDPRYYEGTLNPVEVEQVGHISTIEKYVETDAGNETGQLISFDTDNNWVGSQAEVEVSNLTRLYSINGSFDDGLTGVNYYPSSSSKYYPLGWSARYTQTGPKNTTQVASYVESDDRFVSVENQGYTASTTNPNYYHYAGTTIQWNQTFVNVPYSTSFLLSFDYLYFRGPIYTGTGDALTGNCSINVYMNGDKVWSQSLLQLSSHNTWYHVGSVPVSVPTIGNISEVSIGLLIDEQLLLDPNNDYDGDGIADGDLNTGYITVHLDNVRLVMADPPSFEAVNLQFQAGSQVTPITGVNGTGSATIVNSSYWTTSPLPVQVTSNTSVSFHYISRLRVIRLGNSTYTTNISAEGVEFSSDPLVSAYLSFYYYIGYTGDLSNRWLTVRIPTDWGNVSVYDSFMTDITSLCTIAPGEIWAPDSLLERLGWWFFTAESPNYLQSVKAQKYNDSTSVWSDSSIFRTSNVSRITASFGKTGPQSLLGYPARVQWYLPNGSLWYEEMKTGTGQGVLNSTPVIFGGINTSAGIWSVYITWNNGSEIGCGRVEFRLIHRLRLEPVTAYIETEVGTVVSVAVYVYDDDQGTFLLDSGLSVSGNWTPASIDLLPDAPHNRWAGDFNTSFVSPGNNTVRINASGASYDPSSTEIVIGVLYTRNSLTANVTLIDMALNSTQSIQLEFKDSLGTAINEANISTSIMLGSSNGISWGSVADIGAGNYLINFTGHTSGTYTIRMVASKPNYESTDVTLLIYVDTIPTSLASLNGSADVITYGDQYDLFLHYTNESGYGLSNASVSIQDVKPSTGLPYGLVEDLDDGFYHIRFNSTEIGIYSIVVLANKTNFQPQYLSFTLTVTKDTMFLSVADPAPVLTVGELYNSCVYLNASTGQGLSGAVINGVDLPQALLNLSIFDCGNGSYFVTFRLNDTGFFHFVLAAAYPNYANTTVVFSVSVVPIQTTLSLVTGTNLGITLVGTEYEILLFFESTERSENVTGASIDVRLDEGDPLNWTLEESEEYYAIRFTAPSTGRRIITITASKIHYQPDYIVYILDVSPIPTALEALGTPDRPLFNRTKYFTLNYHCVLNSSGVGRATIDIAGDGHEWFNWTYLGDGVYNFSVTPTELGQYNIQISLTREGFVPQKLTMSFEVVKIPITIVMSPIVWKEGTPLLISLQVMEADSGLPVTGASVSCQISIPNSAPVNIVLHEEAPGNYSGSVEIPFTGENSYSLEITVTKENYKLEEGPLLTSITLVPDYRSHLLSLLVSVGSIGAIIFSTVFISAIVYRIHRKRHQQREAIAIDMKQRLDDAGNLIGVIILHKLSGLPLYSRFVRNAFDESMVAAFITAITHFRAEIDSSTQVEGKVSPMSDIIRIVTMKNLLCAFVTLMPPSQNQERKFETYAKIIGIRYASDFENPPVEVIDKEMTDILDELVNDILDGNLLRPFRVEKVTDGSRELQILLEASNEFPDGVFRLSEIASFLMTTGFRMIDTYLLILKALNEKIVVPAGNDYLLDSSDEE